MSYNINGKLSQAIENLKIEVREFKKLGKSPGKILDLVCNECYILNALEEVGISTFESSEQVNNAVDLVKRKVSNEIVKRGSSMPSKCDIYKLKES